MKIAISSILGDPRKSSTWSNAPAHLITTLESMGHSVTAIDSSYLTQLDKTALAACNVMHGYPWKTVSWFEPARRRRARFVAKVAKAAGCKLIINTGTLDAPVDQNIDYAIWLDNTFSLLKRSAVALPYGPKTIREIERLERLALNGARIVLPFSKHVRNSIIEDYGVTPERVHAIGCGSGPLPPFDGEKNFSQGHLLFVAKHQFSSKGGDLLLEAFPLIRAARPQTKLILIGNDEAREKAAGIDGIEVHGYVDRDVLNHYFHQAAMLVQPMLADPWGQVYLEAMKSRAVVVSLNVAALPELTDNGRLGVLIDKPDPRLLADAVIATYNRPQSELDALTHEAQTHVLKVHSWQTIGRHFAQAISRDNNVRAST